MTDRFERPASLASFEEKRRAAGIRAQEEKEREAQEEARRRALRFATKALAVLSVLLILIVVAQRWGGRLAELPYFQMRTLEVTGAVDRVPYARVEEALLPVMKGNYFSFDLEEARRVAETVPWVKHAVVRRAWPNGLVVDVESYRAVAMYEDGRLVSEEGELFAANPDERENLSVQLPTFYGSSLQVPDIVGRYRDFMRALEPLGATVTDLRFSERGSWSLVMMSPDIPPTPIQLGVDDGKGSVLASLANMVAAYPTMVDVMNGPPSSVDMRYTKAFAASLPDRKALERHREAMRNAGLIAEPEESADRNE